MKSIQFKTGATMPMLGLGTWKSEPGAVYRAVKEALRMGYRHIDCAPIYGNEAEIGRALSDAFSQGITSRDQVWITSKLWNNAHATREVRPALEKTLADLQLETLDLFLIHWPVATKKEAIFPSTADDLIPLDDLPVADTWGAMETLVEQGLCRHIGVSNFSIAKLSALCDGARIRPVMNQIELHPYLQQPAMLDFCSRSGVFLTAYSPLGSMDRPSALKAADEPVLLADPAIAAVAQRNGVTPAQVLIGWALARGTVVIPKSVNPERMQENLAAADLALTPEEMDTIAECDRNRRYVDGSFWAMAGGPYTLANLWDE
jgi:alcohol dehydrogenase (NADP+)